MICNTAYRAKCGCQYLSPKKGAEPSGRTRRIRSDVGEPFHREHRRYTVKILELFRPLHGCIPRLMDGVDASRFGGGASSSIATCSMVYQRISGRWCERLSKSVTSARAPSWEHRHPFRSYAGAEVRALAPPFGRHVFPPYPAVLPDRFPWSYSIPLFRSASQRRLRQPRHPAISERAPISPPAPCCLRQNVPAVLDRCIRGSIPRWIFAGYRR